MQETLPPTSLKELEQEQPGLATGETVEGSIEASEIVSTDPPEEPDISKHPTVPLAPLAPPKRYFQVNWWSLVALALLLILLGEHAIPIIFPVIDSYLHPKAMVTLFAARQPLTFRYSFLAVTGTAAQGQNQIPSRMIFFTSPTRTETIKTTGIGHTPAIQATGSIAFYNEADYRQTIRVGTVLTGNDGIHVVTDETVTVPAGNPPASYGIAETPAHSIQAGEVANIAALDINGLCCLSGIYAKNTSSFTGGEDPKPFPTLSQSDLQHEAQHIAGYLSPLTQQGIQNQMLRDEQFLQPTQCNVHTASSPKVGEQAIEAQVSVSETCAAQVYDYQALLGQLQSQFLQDAWRKAGSNFTQSGNLIVTLEKITLLDRIHATYRLTVSAEGIMIFHLAGAEARALVMQIAGKPLAQAQRELLQLQGVQGVFIKPARQGDSALPTDPNQIAIQVS